MEGEGATTKTRTRPYCTRRNYATFQPPRTCAALIGFRSRLRETIFDFKSGNFQWVYDDKTLVGRPRAPDPSSLITATATARMYLRFATRRVPTRISEAAKGRSSSSSSSSATRRVRIRINDVRFSAARNRACRL